MKKISIIILIVFCVWDECNAQNPEGKINFLIQINDTIIVLSPLNSQSNSISQHAVLKDENTNLKVESTVTMINKDTKDTITEIYPFLSEQERWIDKSWMANRSDTVHRHYNELQTWSGKHRYTLYIMHNKDTMVVNFVNPSSSIIDVKILFKPGQYSIGIEDIINDNNNDVIKSNLFD